MFKHNMGTSAVDDVSNMPELAEIGPIGLSQKMTPHELKAIAKRRM